MMAGPLDWLLPGPDPNERRDPMAWLMAQQNQPVGAVPPDQSGPAENHWMPDAAQPQAPVQPQAQAAPPGEPMQSVNKMPGGRWGNWMQEPGNREFFLSTILSLANGANPGAAFGAGFNAMSGAQQDAARAEEDALAPPTRRGGRRQRFREAGQRSEFSPGREAREYVGHPAWRDERGSSMVARPPPRGRRSRSTLAPAAPGEAPVPVAPNAQAVPPGEVESEAEGEIGLLDLLQGTGRGGDPNLIPAVAPGGREQLLQRVQDRRTAQAQPPLQSGSGSALRGPRTYPDVTAEDLLRLRDSTAPEDQIRYRTTLDRLMRRSPGQGNEWHINNQGRIVPVPIEGAPQRGAGARPQGRFQAASQAGVQSARLDINSIRDYINNQLPGLGQAERTGSLTAGIGPYSNLVNNMRNAVASYMHARSGAQTSVREFEHYVDTFLPKANELHYSTQAKLSNLELQVMLIGRLTGEQIEVNELFQKYNEARAWNGVRAMTAEEFQRILPGLESEAMRRLPTRTNNPPAGTQVAPPAPAGTPGGAGQGEPEWQTMPDGTRYRVR